MRHGGATVHVRQVHLGREAGAAVAQTHLLLVSHGKCTQLFYDALRVLLALNAYIRTANQRIRLDRTLLCLLRVSLGNGQATDHFRRRNGSDR